MDNVEMENAPTLASVAARGVGVELPLITARIIHLPLLLQMTVALVEMVNVEMENAPTPMSVAGSGDGVELLRNTVE
eukprot:CAMPEP_0203713222 /NCGR_PEP_ID=MMETSP0091-20130426/70448_1 /ASSEMBLY_ACC=CAM_ASM_001089 /TAXON_ID=426623 /ORGANISM="Chaetoceros affinis, Strain CCMP159" /LENGTH=76 /DNA_ID=CAMNT_0050591233 /DNA_START=1708 /DNA_END=1938 /DNA_ORIENTATION=+